MTLIKVELIFGGGGLSTGEASLGTFEEMKEAISLLEKGDVRIIDTASTYGDSEEVLGELGAAKTHTLHSKYPGGFGPEPSERDGIITAATEGLKKTGAKQFDVYYLHSPDRRVPWEPQLSAITTLHQEGKINRFGLSNFLANEVEDIIHIARKSNFILPTVYQGSYSAITRRAETELFPTLRKYGIEFYAYSPIAGGFLTKHPDQLRKALGNKSPDVTLGRWDPNTFVGGLYHRLYNKPRMLEGLKLWGDIAERSGVSKAELAYRWILYHSALKGEYGDKIIFGSKHLRQLKDTLRVVKIGPLDADVVEKIEAVWKLVEDESPLDNYNDGLVEMQGLSD